MHCRQTLADRLDKFGMCQYWQRKSCSQDRTLRGQRSTWRFGPTGRLVYLNSPTLSDRSQAHMCYSACRLWHQPNLGCMCIDRYRSSRLRSRSCTLFSKVVRTTVLRSRCQAYLEQLAGSHLQSSGQFRLYPAHRFRSGRMDTAGSSYQISQKRTHLYSVVSACNRYYCRVN